MTVYVTDSGRQHSYSSPHVFNILSRTVYRTKGVLRYIIRYTMPNFGFVRFLPAEYDFYFSPNVQNEL